MHSYQTWKWVFITNTFHFNFPWMKLFILVPLNPLNPLVQYFSQSTFLPFAWYSLLWKILSEANDKRIDLVDNSFKWDRLKKCVLLGTKILRSILSLSFDLARSHSLTLSLALPYSLPLSLSLPFLSLTLPYSLSLSHTHTLSLSLKFLWGELRVSEGQRLSIPSDNWVPFSM